MLDLLALRELYLPRLRVPCESSNIVIRILQGGLDLLGKLFRLVEAN